MKINNYYPVKLIGKNKRAQKIIKYFDNEMLLREYDDFGRPLMVCPNGKQGIYCVSPDGLWNGWFELGVDIDFADQDVINELLERRNNGNSDDNKG